MKVADDIMRSRSTRSMTDAERERSRARYEAIQGGREGNWEPLKHALEKGLIDPTEAREIRLRAGRNELVDRVWSMTYAEALKVLEAATPDEKKALAPLIRRKRFNLLRRHKQRQVADAEAQQ